MLQTAVFVDAGYLHAQGSALLAGSAQSRQRNRLNVPVVVAALVDEAKTIEQTFGIRVHILGIHPARGSQSPDLLAEADTTREWGREHVARWLTVVAASATAQTPSGGAAPAEGDDIANVLKALADERVAAVDDRERAALAQYADQNRGALPSDFDRPSLGTARARLGRDLSPDERRTFREALREALREPHRDQVGR